MAAAHGDRSENAEYHAAKEQLRHIDKRLRYLNGLLERSQVIDPSSYEHDAVRFGSTVAIESLLDDNHLCVTLCGVYEADSERSLISMHAPLAKALVGKKVGDEIQFFVNGSERLYEIEQISYCAFEHLMPYTIESFNKFR